MRALLTRLLGLALHMPVYADTQLLPVEIPLTVAPDAAALMLTGLWSRVDREGQHPTIIALHGCGGLYSSKYPGQPAARHQQMAELLHEAGYHVLLLDSFTARGIRSICTTRYGERTLTPAIRRQDVQAAMRWLQQQAQVDPHNIGLLGWSNGGTTVLSTLNRAPQSDPSAASLPKAAVAFYPGCQRFLSARPAYRLGSPLLILIGANDDWTPAAPCVDLVKQLQPQPAAIEVFPDSYHDFDAPDQPVRLRTDVPNGVHPGAGVTSGSNPAARDVAYRAMLDFFATHLKTPQ